MVEIKSRSFTDCLGNVGMVCECTDTETGESVVRRLSMDDYLSFLGKKVKHVEKFLKIPQLPVNYYDGSISEDDSFKVLLYQPEKTRPVILSTGHYEVPFPALLFYFQGKRGYASTGKVYSLKGDAVPTASSKLYHYPLGNVNLDGHICFGNITLPKVDISNADMLVEEFFLGKTNNDYFKPGEKVSVRYSQEKLVELLSKKEVFPERWLNPTGTDLSTLLKQLY